MDFGLSAVLEEVAFGVASFATVSSAALYSRYRSTAKNLETAPVFTVGPDLSKALRSSPSIPYAIVTGRVFPQSPSTLLSTNSPMPAVISKTSTREFRWMDTFEAPWTALKLDLSDTQHSPSLQFVPFSLSNPNNSPPAGPPSVLVDDVSLATFDNLLVTSSATFTPVPLTLTGLLASFLRGFHSVGMETSEAVLPVGTVITAIGQITRLSSGDTTARISRPSTGGPTTPYILTTRNILDVQSSLRMQATVYKILSLLCGCFTLMTFYALGRKWLPRFRLRRVQRLISRQRATRHLLDGSTSGVEGLSEAQICVTCLQNPREVALFPCGHVCVCADCSLRIQEKCPVCRETVVEVAPVYLS